VQLVKVIAVTHAGGCTMCTLSTVAPGSLLLLLLLLTQAPCSQGLTQSSNRNTAHQRHLKAAADPELQFTLTMTVPTSITSGVKVPLTIPNYVGKQPGAPSPIQPRQLQHQRASCDYPRPTFVLVAGEQATANDLRSRCVWQQLQ
jgi:hypothetical protein